MKFFKEIYNFIWFFFRKRLNKYNIDRLTNKNPTIISSNCNGAIILHDLNLKYLTPTVNLFMYPKDFVKFVSNLEMYLSKDVELIEVMTTSQTYPIGRLLDIEIHFMHYKTFEEARNKWYERSTRIQWENIFLMMTDRDGCKYEDMVLFDKLPFPKVIFTNKSFPEIKSAVYIKGFEQDSSVGVLSDKKNIFGKRYLDEFDYVSFLNNQEIYKVHNEEADIVQ